MTDVQNSKADNIFTTIGKAAIAFAEKLNQWNNWWQEHEAQICEYLVAFAYMMAYYRAIDKLIHNNVVCTYDLNKELATHIDSSDNVEIALKSYYFSNENDHMNVLLSRCQNGLVKLQRDRLFVECVSSYSRSEYHLAIIGVFALADGVLADITSNPKITSFRVRMNEVRDRINDKVPLSEYDWRLLSLSAALEKFEYSPFDKSDFEGTEPSYPHRHWLLHGRSRNTYTEYGFLSAVLWLDAMLFFAEVLENHNEPSGDNTL